MTVVEVADLVVRYGTTTAVDGLSFVADEGRVTAVLGPNGAGKTSTIECLEGYRRPDGGRVRVCGLDPVSQRSELTSRVGVMLQEGGVHTSIRPREALRLYAAYYDTPRDPEALLDFVGLRSRADVAWRSLSGGEKQRLSLALAIVGRPEVAFLDEPTAGVDISGKRLIRELIASLRDDGVTVLLTSHDLAEVEELADRIVIIDRGRAVADGTPAELLASNDEITFGAVAGLDTAAMSAAIGAAVSERAPGDYAVSSSPSPALVAAITAWLAHHDVLIDDLQAGRARLEDVFLRLTDVEDDIDAGTGVGADHRAESAGEAAP